MLGKFLNRFDSSYKEFKSASKIADEILKKEQEISNFTDEELQNKTEYFKDKLSTGSTLDDILVEAFAVVREASFRVTGMKPFYVQVIGGIVLHHGNIAEMKTGEGKTLTSVMPAYLNALEGNGVHIITVNDYLASREATGEIGDIFRWLGLTVGLNLRDLTPQQKQEVYNCDIVYSTNNEIGFDYLRDNMVLYKNNRVQTRGLNYAIIDEVDSILVDEARTPLIISGGVAKAQNLYELSDRIVKSLKVDEDYTVEVKSKAVSLTETGIHKCEKMLNLDNLYDLNHAGLVHHLHQALKANYTLDNEVDYIIQDGKIVIVDQFTGRLMPGRAFSEGLHQAIEAKEGVEIKEETRTMATITFQNLFRMYNKLSGMTGTAKTEEEEFRDIYNMYVVEIPTNKPVIRDDKTDYIFPSNVGKYKKLIKDVKAIHEKGQPILIGTVAVETSEYISKLFDKERIPHEVLNAKNHFREADIIAKAGEKYSVTIATNMAGRGTDIKLSEEVKALGGLYVIGTERHDSRRIDNQLRGRSGRQGDPGTTQFYISYDDKLLSRMGNDFTKRALSMITTDEDEPLTSKLYTRAIESAQRQIEGNNYDARKRVLQYDEVLSIQREIMYKIRNEVLDSDSYHDKIVSVIPEVIEVVLMQFVAENEFVFDENVINSTLEYINSHYLDDNFNIEKLDWDTQESFLGYIQEKSLEYYENKVNGIEDENIKKEFEKIVSLRVYDTHWTKHIDTMAHLKEGIGLRGYAQQNPLREYTMEGKRLFDDMMLQINKDLVQFTMRSTVRPNAQREEVIKGKAMRDSEKENVKKNPIRKSKKIGVNSPCPCGSGKKYKRCCGKQ